MLNRVLIVWIVYAGVMGFAVGGSLVAAYQIPLSQHEGSTNPEQNPSDQNSKEKSDEALARYTLWLTIFTGVMAFATVGLGIATVGLYATGEKQIEVALKAATAAELSAKAAVAIELPVFKAEPDQFGFGSSRIGDGPQIENCIAALLKFVNLGRTQAVPIEVHHGWTFGQNLPDAPVYQFITQFDIDAVIKQSGTGFVNLSDEFEFPLGISPYDEVRSERSRLWFYCKLVYLDFMQTRHEAAFCWRRIQGIGRGRFISDATAAYNRKT